MKQVADEHDLQIFEGSAAPTRQPRLPAAQMGQEVAPQEEDLLAARLAALEAS